MTDDRPVHATYDGGFSAFLGVEQIETRPGYSRCRLMLKPHHLSTAGRLGAAATIGLADAACGYGCRASLPEGRSAFATVDVKTNFTSSMAAGVAVCEAKLVHAGRSSQLWDATVTDETTGKVIALVRCTQALLGD